MKRQVASAAEYPFNVWLHLYDTKICILCFIYFLIITPSAGGLLTKKEAQCHPSNFLFIVIYMIGIIVFYCFSLNIFKQLNDNASLEQKLAIDLNATR